ncbi:MAG: tetratricopeptide repeat protein [Nitrospirae bacterium]|nr:tetratricopeptide repeat protein [Nitrospirota bacterium]
MALYIKRDQIKNAGDERWQIYQIIHQLIKDGKKAEALMALERFVQANPDYAVAQNNLGVLYFEVGDKKKAFAHYQKAAEIEPSNPIFLKNLADYYLGEQCLMEEAMQIYLKLLSLNSEDVDTFLIIGNIAAALGKKEDAAVFYNKVLEIEPWNLTAMDNLEALQKAQ